MTLKQGIHANDPPTKACVHAQPSIATHSLTHSHSSGDVVESASDRIIAGATVYETLNTVQLCLDDEDERTRHLERVKRAGFIMDKCLSKLEMWM
jgi:hypothetical protein